AAVPSPAILRSRPAMPGASAAAHPGQHPVLATAVASPPPPSAVQRNGPRACPADHSACCASASEGGWEAGREQSAPATDDPTAPRAGRPAPWPHPEAGRPPLLVTCCEIRRYLCLICYIFRLRI